MQERRVQVVKIIWTRYVKLFLTTALLIEKILREDTYYFLTLWARHF